MKSKSRPKSAKGTRTKISNINSQKRVRKHSIKSSTQQKQKLPTKANSQFSDSTLPSKNSIYRSVYDFSTDTPEAEISIKNYMLPEVFSHEVLAECKKLASTNFVSNVLQQDLCALPFVTIDGEDAKDFDDAIYGEDIIPQNKSNTLARWKLFVAIADVSHFVTPLSALDNEAYLRATSVYFPRNVVPMLPPVLSENLCSLMPEKVRYVMVCEMEIYENGDIGEYKFYQGLIKSQARLTYKQVEKILFAGSTKEDEAKNISKKLPTKVIENLKKLKHIYYALRWQRDARGALDLDSKEYKFTFKNGKVESIYNDFRGESHKLVEECMIAANVCAARFLEDKTQTLFRVHEPPSTEKLEILKNQLKDFGIKYKFPKAKKTASKAENKQISPQAYAEILEAVKAHPHAQFLQYMVLRSLKNAIYTPHNHGHFGLGLTHYAHFTSPIRRYPDLLVHRGIKKVLLADYAKNKKLNKNIKKNSTDTAQPEERNWIIAGEHCSYCEKRADSASRDSNMILRCELAKQNLGETLSAVVSGVTKFGLFVQLEKSFADGLIPMKNLGKYYGDYVEFDESKNQINAPKTKSSIGLGTEVLVRILQVNVWERKMELELIQIIH